MTCVVCIILFIHRVLVQHNKDQTQYANIFCYCMKVKCATFSFDSGIVVFYAAVTIICIDTA